MDIQTAEAERDTQGDKHKDIQVRPRIHINMLKSRSFLKLAIRHRVMHLKWAISLHRGVPLLLSCLFTVCLIYSYQNNP